MEAKTRVEEGTATELKSQVETVTNKDEMIDVISCPGGHGYPGVVTHWSAPGCRGGHIAVSRRMRVLERGIQPAFSGKCPVQVNQFPSPRPCWTKPERSATDWSFDAERCHLLTELASLRDQHAQIAEMFNMKNIEGTE